MRGLANAQGREQRGEISRKIHKKLNIYSSWAPTHSLIYYNMTSALLH